MSPMTLVKSLAAAFTGAPPILAPPREVAAGALARPFGVVLATGALVLLVLRLAVSAVLPTWSVALLAPATALALVVAVFRAGVALGPLASRGCRCSVRSPSSTPGRRTTRRWRAR